MFNEKKTVVVTVQNNHGLTYNVVIPEHPQEVVHSVSQPREDMAQSCTEDVNERCLATASGMRL